MMGELREITADVLRLDPDEIDPDTEFVDDLDADSLDMIEIAMAVEDEYGIEIPDERLEDVEDLSDFEDVVEERRSAA